MDCQTARESWHRIDGDARHDAALKQHLIGCESCRRYVADMRQIVESLAELRDRTESIRSKGAAPQADARRWGLATLIRVAALIAIVAGITVVAVTWRVSPTPVVVETEPLSGPEVSSMRTQLDGPDSSLGDRPALGLTLYGESARTMLVVAVATAEPDVQMYWLYPTLRGETEPSKTDN